MKYRSCWSQNWIFKNYHIVLPGLLLGYFLYLVCGFYFQEDIVIEERASDNFYEPDLSLILEYKFTPEQMLSQGRTTEKKLNAIRSFVTSLNQKPVPKVIQDELLILFLIACKNDLELTKQTIVYYYGYKKNGPELFDDRRIANEGIQTALNTLHMSVLPERLEDNVAIAFFRFNDSDSNFDMVNIFKVSCMLIDIAQEENPPNAIIVIIDSRGLGWKHVGKIQRGPLLKFSRFLHNGLPIRVKEIHVLNTSYIINAIIDIVIKFIMNMETLSQLLHLHELDMQDTELFKIVPKKYWPMEYSGDLPSFKILHNDTLTKFQSKQHFWEMEEKIRKQYY